MHKQELEATKLKDKDGNPMLCYRGERSGKLRTTGDVYFTPQKEYAEAFAEMLFLDAPDTGRVFKARLLINNPFIVTAAECSSEWDDFVDYGLDTAKLREEGYDSAILQEEDGSVDQVITFYPGQIFKEPSEEALHES